MTDKKQNNNTLQNIKNCLKKNFYGEEARYSRKSAGSGLAI